MSVSYNGADPRQVAWAKQEMENQRAMRVALGYDKKCPRCGRSGPKVWFDGEVCGPQMTQWGPCEPPRRTWWAQALAALTGR